MRHAILTALLLGLCHSIFAQGDRPSQIYRHAIMVENEFRQLDTEVRLLAQGLRRDAFIVVQLMAAGRELTDFQRQVALQKAADRVQAASRKAFDKPPADGRTIQILERLTERLEKARDQGLSADVDAVRADLLRGAGQIQHIVFIDLADLQRIRKLYGEIQARNGATIVDFDDALGEALAAALGMLEVKVSE
jgi:hypothetical protein